MRTVVSGNEGGQEVVGEEDVWSFWGDDKVLHPAKVFNYMGIYIVKTQWIYI